MQPMTEAAVPPQVNGRDVDDDDDTEQILKELGGLDPRLQSTYRHRSGTFEKKPEMMLGTINFLLICHVRAKNK